MVRRVGFIALGVLLCGCAGTVPPPPPIVSIEAPVPPRPRDDVSVVVPQEPVRWADEAPAKSVGHALQQAVRTPKAAWFRHGALVYPYEPGARYRVRTEVGRLTRLRFAPSEVLGRVMLSLPTCGELKTDDPEVNAKCFLIEETQSGEGAEAVYHVGIRPGSEGLTADAMVTTSAGVYDLELVSGQGSFIPVVQWDHPRPVVKAAPPQPKHLIGVGYTWESRTETKPWWMPVNIWTEDQTHTLIAFPPSIKGREFPVLYAVDQALQPRLTNARVDETGLVLIADGDFSAGLLRVGKDPDAELVDIRRSEGFQYVWCPGSQACPMWPQPTGQAALR